MVKKKLVMIVLVCLMTMGLYVAGIAQSYRSDLYVYVRHGRTYVTGASVIAVGLSGWSKLEYTLTPQGYGYYGYVQPGNYDIHVDGTKMRNLYVRGRRVNKIYADSGLYAEVTCLYIK
ncbi:MAG: hypothetical protein DRI57_27815 [Deltaproteobacteria bacterium]|nr:MAG: hypothetical protein DRI57_27815 [Deltaproteobacteria bacterium]